MKSKAGTRPQKVEAEKLIDQVVHRHKGIISDKESIFYALSVGFNQDPLREQDFKFTTEIHEDFEAFPLVATVCHQTNFIQALLDSSNIPIFNANNIRHSQQRFIFLKDKIDLSLEYEHETRFTDWIDKGKNAIAWFEVKTFAEIDGKKELICLSQQGIFIFGLGGFGFKGLKLYPSIPAIPKRNPDILTKVDLFKNQAFYFRLTGDRNPLHIDPKNAAEQKLEKPIIHGMATYGSVARVFIQEFLKNDSSRLKSYSTKFLSHVFPGETLKLSFWKLDENNYVFEAETTERKTKVLSGSFELKPTAKL